MIMATSSNETEGHILRQLKFETFGQIRCARLNSEARLPLKVHNNSSSYNLFTCEDTLVTPNKVTLVNTG